MYYHNFLLLQSDCACVLRRELKDTAPPDLLKRDFHSDGSRRQVVEDITYLPVMESRLGGGTRVIIIHSDAVSTYRRCGKSTLLKMYRDSLLASGIEDSRTIFINFEDYDNRELLEPENLHAFLKSRLCNGKMTYVFLDEIQNVKDFQRVVDSLFLDEETDIYMTGSNAFLLSGELATLLSGRYVEIKTLPLSFAEFIGANELESTPLSQSYRRHVETGSFPYASAFGDNKVEVHDYLRGVYSTIVLEDIIARYKIADSKMLESVMPLISGCVRRFSDRRALM